MARSASDAEKLGKLQGEVGELRHRIGVLEGALKEASQRQFAWQIARFSAAVTTGVAVGGFIEWALTR
jgi:hypothetical protein